MVKGFLVIFALSAIVYGAFKGVGVINKSEQGVGTFSAKEIAEAIANESVGRVPNMINDELRLDSVKSKGSEVVFSNTIISGTSDEYLDKDVKSVYLPVMKQSLCADKNIQSAFSKGVAFRYVYSGNNAVKITEFVIDGPSCGGDA
ncbi:hypothetical protein Y5S_00059 [Alcanivorax nanhaiticus]|uniref:Uncharacterized protein n=1 Tax=Alcanivorax nanhaiticus TaxID=1177154 RepID=A0A095SP71_9GAMM|nr:hypothetical protein [Alcanivorax nanhaiticus]KGD66392.1 hypothetical protein Y5S_00059 [Alcanivorax nanhaiticus]